MSVLRIGVPAEVFRLDPHGAIDYDSGQIVDQLYESPFSQAGPGTRPEPVLLDGPLQSAGAGAWEARIRRGACFSDGSPVVAGDVVASLERARALVGPIWARGDGDRVVLQSEEPAAIVESLLSKRWCAIVRTHEHGFLGTGPYMLDGPPRDGMLRLVRNPHARRRAGVDALEFLSRPADSDGRSRRLVDDLRNGRIDFSAGLTRDDVREVPGLGKRLEPGRSTAILFLNCEREPLSELAVRRAIALGVDRLGLAGRCWENATAFRAHGLLPPGLGRLVDGVHFNPVAAREKLAGRRHRLRLLLPWAPRPYLPAPDAVARELATQLQTIGIEIDPVPTRSGQECLDLVCRGDYDLMLGGWVVDSPDPADFLEALLASTAVPAPTASIAFCSNISRWRDRRTDVALDRFRRQRSDDALGVLARILRDEVPLVPLMYGATVLVHAWRVRGVALDPNGMPDYAAFEIDPEERATARP